MNYLLQAWLVLIFTKCSDLTLLQPAINAIVAFKVLREQKIDLIFLDIKMPKLIGTDFLRIIPNRPKAIFITAYRDYAFDDYELDIVNYLLKPVFFAEFMKAVAKATKLISSEENNAAIKTEYNNKTIQQCKCPGN